MAKKQGTRDAGCGCTKGILRYLPIPYADTFYTACVAHDMNYEKGMDRKGADKQFFHDMVHIIEQRAKKPYNENSPLKSWWLVQVAMMYYASVRVFGGFYFGERGKR